MYAYSQVLLAELHLHPVSPSVTASRRAAHQFAQREAVRERAVRSRPVARPPLVRRLLTLVHTPA